MTKYFFGETKFFVFPLSQCTVEITKIHSHAFLAKRNFQRQCGKTKNLVSPKNISSNQLFSKFFSRNVTFTKFLPKMCETKSQQFPNCGTSTTHCSLTLFCQKFRESNAHCYSWYPKIISKFENFSSKISWNRRPLYNKGKNCHFCTILSENISKTAENR